jgi:hypothetical protein
MSNRDQIAARLHVVLLDIGEGSDRHAAVELRNLISWIGRAAQPSAPTMRPGMFCAPVLQPQPDVIFLEGAFAELSRIEVVWKQTEARDATESIRQYLASL